MLALAGIYAIVVTIWALLAVLGLAPWTTILGYCMAVAIPVLIHDVYACISVERWGLAAWYVAVILGFFSKILAIFG